MNKSSDLEQATHSYVPLSDQPESSNSSPGYSRNVKIISGVVVSLLLLSGLILLIVNQGTKNLVDEFDVGCVGSESVKPNTLLTPSRGVSQGVSEKTFRVYSGENDGYPWTNAMLAWQRTAFHFQPENNWMNDPNGPLFYMGWYHFFYQYNPESPVWGNISWGHAVSKDLINWLHLPVAMVPDQWYDINGVWTGSATFLADGQLVMLYTGGTNEHVQVQNLAYPANLSDPLLIDWVKYKNNPVLVPPPGIGAEDFRDPATAWLTKDGKWRIAIGSKVNKTGITLVYETTNFTSYNLLDGMMHSVPGTGMWECVDFYPVSTTSVNGLDTSVDGPGVKHVLKESSEDDQNDYYAIGTYDPITGKWKPDNPDLDVGIGLRYDYGMFYAAKSFYDQNKQRRILWGWIQETDSEVSDLLKGWASLQAIPRTVVYDMKTGTNLVQWPVVEVEKLRKNSTKFTDVKLAPGSIVPLNIGMATQLDIVATFELDKDALQGLRQVEDVRYDCSTRGVGARGALGPFGILVIADEALTEYTPVYFYIAKDSDGSAITFFCADESKSSTASDVSKRVHGSAVPVLKGEKLSMRVLVDHSIIESFAQGGRTTITSRIYPTRAIYGAAKLFLFNNATQARVTAAVKVWEMDSANIQRFPFDKSL